MSVLGKRYASRLRRGAKSWNVWIKKTKTSTRNVVVFGEDLRDVDLSGVDLSQAVLGLADFSRINLSHSKLTGVWLHSAILSEADFTAASMRGAIIESGTLRNANLTSADLIGTHFYDMNLRGANFTNARMLATIFTKCDLRRTVGLETVKHDGPSSIGIDTIYKSRGDIPDVFLRGCGVPDNLITFIPSLIAATEGLQFYSCFISYSERDGEFARYLYKRLRAAHLRVWFAPEDVQAGKKLHEQIDQAIRVHDKLIIVVSEQSLASDWVATEIRSAFKEERLRGKRKLFPVRLVDMRMLRDWQCFDPDSGKDLAVELRQYFIPDFSNWRNSGDFETAITRLVHDLRYES